MRLLLVLALVVLGMSITQYKVVSVTQNTSAFTIQLTYTGNETYYVKPTSPIIRDLLFTIRCFTTTDLSFKITDLNKTRYEVPQIGVFPIDPVGNFSFPLTNSLFQFNYQQNPFDFSIIRKFDNEVIFDSSKGELIFSQYYMEITTVVTSRNLYGFSERFSDSFRIKPGKFTIFNRDRGQVMDRGDGQQTYASFPIYLIRENSGNYHLNYFRNNNAMDIIVAAYSVNQYTLTYKTIGGVLDFRIFLGEKNPEAAIQKFQLYEGRSQVPPFWSLGFHQCRWGYKNVSYLEDVLKNYEQNDIPLDTIWSDIDYMIDYEDFTIDESRFPLDRMAAITDNYHYIPIIDAGIKAVGASYDEGVKRNVFVKNANGSNYIGKVWPGATAFVDFFHPNASFYWSDMLNKLYSKVKFSGVWLDMNELANFCDGACNDTTPSKFDYSKDLPYQPGSDNVESHTISLNATHYGNLTEANVHAYFGFLESEATHTFLESKGLRPFIISRSSALGSNKYTGHWTGDNYANFEFLRTSIFQNFMFQFWGIQMVGADICGFGGNTTEELCARWFQLGSFYPFARDHNDLNGISQEPYALGPKVLAAAKTNLKLRYSLLKFIYRHFINKRGTGTIIRPLFIDFPNDPAVFNDEVAETQFIIGAELMLAPIVKENTTFRSVYFPAGVNWYDFSSGKLYKGGDLVAVQNQITDAVPIFLREGTGLLMQNVVNVRKTSQLGNEFILRAAFGFNAKNSTADLKKYDSAIGLLSIKDYNNETNIDYCLRQGCEYSFLAVLAISNSSKSLEIDVIYTGAQRLNEPQIINRVELYYDGGKITQTLTNSIVIQNPGRYVFPLNNAEHTVVNSRRGYSGAIDVQEE